VVINETWFFREMGPLEAWGEAILPELAKNGHQCGCGVLLVQWDFSE
jgi:chemotaxis methyl-accepting protein methylase